jgi:hypothetical protein
VDSNLQRSSWECAWVLEHRAKCKSLAGRQTPSPAAAGAARAGACAIIPPFFFVAQDVSTPPVSGQPWPVQRPRIFLGTFAYYFLAILLPIVLAGRYCNDDIIRSISGNYGWNNNGRHLANVLMRILQLGGSRTVDIGPLPQLLAAVVLSVIAVLLARRFAIKSVLLAILVAIPLGAQPFFLENMAYRFDAACMAAAMLCALLPIVFLGQDKTGWRLGTLSLLAAFNFYQPAFNVFLLFALFEVMNGQLDNAPLRSQWRLIGFRLSQAIAAAVVYKLLFASSMKDWMQIHGAMVTTPAAAVANLQTFSAYVVDSLGSRLSILFGVLIAASLGIVIATCVRQAVSGWSARSRFESLCLFASALLFPVMAGLLLFGPMLLLQEPVLMPRVLVGVGAMISASLISAHFALRKWVVSLHWEIGIGSVWAMSFAIIAAVFGNASADQRRYEEAIASQLSDDLAFEQNHQAMSAFVLRGSAGYSPMVRRVIYQWPLIDKLVVPYLRENDFNTNAFLLHYIPTPQQPVDASPADAGCQLHDAFVRRNYRVTLYSGVAIVTLRPDIESVCGQLSR